MPDRFTHQEMADHLHAMVASKREFVRNHSGGKDPRPDWVLTLERRNLAVLQQAEHDYALAAARQEKAA